MCIPCHFYGSYIIIHLNMSQNSKGVMQYICSILDSALHLFIVNNFMWKVIHQLCCIKYHLWRQFCHGCKGKILPANGGCLEAFCDENVSIHMAEFCLKPRRSFCCFQSLGPITGFPSLSLSLFIVSLYLSTSYTNWRCRPLIVIIVHWIIVSL